MSNWEQYTFISERFLRVQSKVNNISPDDFEDMLQSIFLHLVVYQVSVEALSQEELEKFISQSVARYVKRWKRYRKKFKPLEDEFVPMVNATRNGELNESGFVILQLDIAAILKYLTARQVVICQCLMEGQTPRRIRRVVNCSHATMTKELSQIRQQLILFDYC
jgi:DNA-binding NarL/FixJ family response regulator